MRLSRFRPAGLRDGSRFFPELESLRGIAIVLVVLYHAEGILRLETTGHVAGSVNPLNLKFLGRKRENPSPFKEIGGFVV